MKYVIIISAILAFLIISTYNILYPTEKYLHGYIINKYIDTCLVTGRYVPYNTYGIQYKIVYQEDKTMSQTIKTVDKNIYYTTEISTYKLIKYTK